MRIFLAALLIALPVSAVEPEQREAWCSKDGWCLVRQETMQTLLDGIKKLSAHVTELRLHCGWDK